MSFAAKSPYVSLDHRWLLPFQYWDELPKSNAELRNGGPGGSVSMFLGSLLQLAAILTKTASSALRVTPGLQPFIVNIKSQNSMRGLDSEFCYVACIF